MLALMGCPAPDDPKPPEPAVVTPEPTGDTAPEPQPTSPSTPTGETGSTDAITLKLTAYGAQTVTSPGALTNHHHATVARIGDATLMAYNVGSQPTGRVLLLPLDKSGIPLRDPLPLSDTPPPHEKPDIESGTDHFAVAFEGAEGRVLYRRMTLEGNPLSPDTEAAGVSHLETSAPDIALRPDGSGMVVYNESGGTGQPLRLGRHMLRTFGADDTLSASPEEIEISGRTTPDVTGFEEGFALIYAAMVPAGANFTYELHGEVRRDDGTILPFRADDRPATWPSRPTIATTANDLFVVSYRDKTSAEGMPYGAYLRFLNHQGVALAPSMLLDDPALHGDRVVVASGGSLAVVVWEQDDPLGTRGVFMTAVDIHTFGVVLPPTQLGTPGGLLDARPDLAVTWGPGEYDASILVTWETHDNAEIPHGIHTQRVELSLP